MLSAVNECELSPECGALACLLFAFLGNSSPRRVISDQLYRWVMIIVACALLIPEWEYAGMK